MAIKSTIFKLNLSVTDISRGYYEDHALTIAKHPSETDTRMMLRLVAFALNAHEHLQFTKGLSDMDEPDIWQKSLTGEIDHWIDLGQPTEKKIRQACGKSRKVSIYTYQKNSALIWYESLRESLERFKHLRIVQLNLTDEKLIDKLIDRSMRLSCVIEDDRVLVTNDQSDSLNLELLVLKDFAGSF